MLAKNSLERVQIPLIEKIFFDEDLVKTLKELRDRIPDKTLFLVNSRKFLLSRIYFCLQQVLGRSRSFTVLDVNKLSPGTFTNPACEQFCQPPHVVAILTKNHHLKEKRILDELEKARVPVTLVALGCSAEEFHPDARITVPNVRSLYHLVYNLSLMDSSLSLKDFYEKFALLEKSQLNN